MSSARTALRERVAALGRARRAFDAGRLDDAERVLQDELARWPANRDAQALLAEVTRARGVMPGHDAAPPAPAPKAGPEAWSSFERRIRERKATRLRDHIRASLDAGSPEAALQALEELDTVAPGVALPEDIAERVRAQHLDERPRHDAEPEPEPVRKPARALDSELIQPPATDAALARLDGRDPGEAEIETPGSLLRQPPSSTATRESAGEATRTADPVIPLSPVAPGSALELFPPASEPAGEPAAQVHTLLEELPLRQSELEHRGGRPSELPDDSSMRLRLAPAAEVDAPRSATPLKERGAHLLGLLLVVSSIVALSGWAGYRLFEPSTAITEVSSPESAGPAATGDAEDALSSSQPSPARAPESEQAANMSDREATGTAGGSSASAASSGTVASVPPATAGITPAPGVTESTPPASASSSLPDRTGTTPSPRQPTASPVTPTVVPSVTNERTAPPPPPSLPAETRAQSEPGQPPGISGGAGGLSSARSPQPTPEPVPPLAQGTSQPANIATQPASPAPARDSGGDDNGAPASAPADEAGTAAADAGTTAHDADAMRGLIEGYLAGYNNLDAGGVRAVWPGVDQRALSRAFGQLRSQHLSFSRCEVRTTGDAGHGFCTGHAAWRPRVGGGEKIEQRVWRFDFAQRNDDWIIQKVNVER